MIRLNYFFILFFCATALASCCKSDDDSPNTNANEPWSKSWEGKSLLVPAYPDLFCNYWYYAYSFKGSESNSKLGLKIKAQYPNARYFGYTIYNDANGNAIGGIDDFELNTDSGKTNPFVAFNASPNETYTLYLIPQGAKFDRKNKNVCTFDPSIDHVNIMLRLYLMKTEFGDVALPTIEAFDVNTGEPAKLPKRLVSSCEKFPVRHNPRVSDDFREVCFFRAPQSDYFPNFSTDYLFARTRLSNDSICAIRFKPIVAPTSVKEYNTADARYWSFCLGAESNTYSYYSLADDTAKANTEDGFITFIIADANNRQIEKIENKVNLKQGVYLFKWDSKKLDHEQKAISNLIVMMYRNILPQDSTKCPYSMQKMDRAGYRDPYQDMQNPNRELAHKALGDYGAYGEKYSTQEYLNNNFDYNKIRQDIK